MSDSASSNREVAYRLFAAECNDASYSYSESGEERAPNYVVTPTGARVNRLFAVGVLTEVSQAGDSILRARVVDPTGAFIVYAGQYQPDAMAVLDSLEPPTFVAVTGKIRTFQPDDSNSVYTSIRPEEINEVDSDTRDRWTVSTAERTLERVATIAAALDTEQTGEELRNSLRESEIDPSLAAGIPIAIEQYGTTPAYLEGVQRLALDASRLAAGEIDTVDSLSLAPDQGEGTIEPVTEADGIPIDTPTTGTKAETADTPDRTTTTSSDGKSVEQTDSDASRTQSTSATVEPEPEHEQKTEQQPPTAEDAVTDERADEPADERTERPSIDTDGERSTGTDIDTETDVETGTDTVTNESPSEGSDEFDPEEFELDEEVRQEIESEYGTEFSTAAEVDAPGEAGIETNESDVSDEMSESVALDESDSTQARTETEPSFDDLSDKSTIEEETTAEPTSTSDTTTETETEDIDTDIGTDADAEPEAEMTTETEAVDIEAVLLNQMHELDDGDGADRETLIERVSESADVSSEAVEDAIQDALMSGQCYEPDGETLKPI